MKLQAKKTLSCVVFSAGLLLAASAPVHAGLVHGSLDPDYGSPFPSLGWRATFDLYVSNNCLTAVGTGSLDFSNFGTISDCSTSQFQNVELDFYDSSDPNKTTVESFLLGSFAATSAPDTSLDETQSLIGVSINQDQIVGFDSSASFRVTALSPIAGATAVGTYDFSLVISSDPTVANLYYIPTGAEQSVQSAADNGQSSKNAPVVTFFAVPEPGSLALCGLALVGLAVGRRRKG